MKKMLTALVAAATIAGAAVATSAPAEARWGGGWHGGWRGGGWGWGLGDFRLSTVPVGTPADHTRGAHAQVACRPRRGCGARPCCGGCTGTGKGGLLWLRSGRWNYRRRRRRRHYRQRYRQ